jgi:hypothetical protein
MPLVRLRIGPLIILRGKRLPLPLEPWERGTGPVTLDAVPRLSIDTNLPLRDNNRMRVDLPHDRVREYERVVCYNTPPTGTARFDTTRYYELS